MELNHLGWNTLEEHIFTFGWALEEEIKEIDKITLRINDLLVGMFRVIGIKLVDFKIEVGRQFEDDMQRLILADEISPDSCRLWDVETNQKLDKDVFRRDLGSLTDAYSEVARRLGILPKNGGSAGPKLVE